MTKPKRSPRPVRAWVPVLEDGGIPIRHECIAVYSTRRCAKIECDCSGGEVLPVLIVPLVEPMNEDLWILANEIEEELGSDITKGIEIARAAWTLGARPTGRRK